MRKKLFPIAEWADHSDLSGMDGINGKIDHLLSQLSKEGLLNDQFQQLMQLQDEANPNFVKARIAIVIVNQLKDHVSAVLSVYCVAANIC